MPNARVLEEKKKIVEELTEKLRSQSGVFVDYKGINVNEDTQMRVKLREANVDYTVIKNTLMRFAIKNVGFDELDPILNGTTSLAISKDDPIAPARLIKEYADKFNNYFEIKAGFMDGKVLSVSEVNALAVIPPLPILQSQLLGTLLAPIVSLAAVLKAIAEKDSAPADVEIAAPEVEAETTAAEQTADAAEAAVEPEAVVEPEVASESEAVSEPEAEAPADAEVVAEEAAAEAEVVAEEATAEPEEAAAEEATPEEAESKPDTDATTDEPADVSE